MSNFYHLIQGDCLKVLPKMKSETIDLVFADPPYNIGGRGGTHVNWNEKNFKSIKAKWDNISEEDFTFLNMKFIEESYRLLKIGMSIFITGTFHNIFNVKSILDSLNYKFRNFITWYKPNAMPMQAAHFGYFAYSCEYICFYTKGKDRIKTWNYDLLKSLNNGLQMRDLFTIRLYRDKKWNTPSQKPEELLKILILATTNEGDVVLDPFLGSGTTMKVCQDLKRSCIGIEINPEYCDIIKKRCFGRQFLDHQVKYKFEVSE